MGTEQADRALNSAGAGSIQEAPINVKGETTEATKAQASLSVLPWVDGGRLLSVQGDEMFEAEEGPKKAEVKSDSHHRYHSFACGCGFCKCLVCKRVTGKVLVTICSEWAKYSDEVDSIVVCDDCLEEHMKTCAVMRRLAGEK